MSAVQLCRKETWNKGRARYSLLWTCPNRWSQAASLFYLWERTRTAGYTLVISNFKWGQATYTFEFADGAVATVNKDIWTFEFSQLPVVPEEEIPTSDNETTSFDTSSLETDTVDDQTENTSIQNSIESTVEKVYEETLSTEVSYEPEETVATTITESSTTESDTEVGTGQDEIHETVFTETISSDDSIASSETELSNDLDVN